MGGEAYRATKVNSLQQRLGVEWPSIEQAYADTLAMRDRLAGLFSKRTASDTSVVVFGSVARFEVTSKSDTDWILLVDGSATPEHKKQETDVKQLLLSENFIEPGQSGIFGRFVGSHDLIHRIGGEDDLNSNTTRRVLLLLESLPLGDRAAYDRVRRQILRRYLDDDRGLTHGSGSTRVPRFLLNDLTRYWRTVTVDFVYKQVADQDKKWALRNAKLRMSRKLVFAAGLLRCFFCDLDESASDARQALQPPNREVSLLLTYLEDQFAMSPLESVAKACLDLNIRPETALSLFNSYNAFLAVLDDDEKRGELARAQSHEDLRTSMAWKEVRELTKPFHEALVTLFLKEDERLTSLTMEYGIF
jgi:predicted nucleotidyltransferase